MEITGRAIAPPAFDREAFVAKNLRAAAANSPEIRHADNAKSWLQSQGILFHGATPKRRNPNPMQHLHEQSTKHDPKASVQLGIQQAVLVTR